MTKPTKEETQARIATLVKGDAQKARVFRWMQGAERDGMDLLSMLAGCNAERDHDDLPAEEAAKVVLARELLAGMVADGLLVTSEREGRTYYRPCKELAGRVVI